MTEDQRTESIDKLLKQLESPHLSDAQITRIEKKLALLQPPSKAS